MIRLRFFAGLRETLEVGDERLELPDGIDTLAGLEHWLQRRGTPWDEALANSRLHVAVNQEIVNRDAAIRDGDEIAWFPPVTGG